ncbi:MAG TPA: cytochrome d ubiquinol oxidase subunit II [Armatimonadetes bacterium]|jgi:cytochrome d ubiquinol oxidase subunit II|nr:cytochrome d ubiquinol oxidase subunit II [Armatimonadota bacterium]HCE00658.1 cytochrome d ubiquinol oxidase subunit II [Armatimonadota bacterium]
MNYPFDLQTVWFLLVGVLLTGYAILDGFDLGIGTVYLLAKGDKNRRTLLNAIGPVWDGNEVWLITGGGALFAAFPHVYATVFSGFYLPFVLLLFGLIFRAVAIEFRSKLESQRWRNAWDVSFSVASVLIALLAGVALGNMIVGVPLNQEMEYTGTFFTLLNPYSLLVGVTTVALFTMHGSIYAVLKTEGELQEQARKWVFGSIIFFALCYVLTTMSTLLFFPHMAEKFRTQPILLAVPMLNVLALFNIPREIYRRNETMAFVSSCVAVATLMALFGIGLYPNLVLSNPNPEYSLTIRNASSSNASLTIMLTIAILGMPFVLAYTSAIYWVFRGKVNTEALHY